MSSLSGSKQQKTDSKPDQNTEPDALAVRWALICAAVVLGCGGLGLWLQQTFVGSHARLFAKCKQNPAYSRECAEILASKGILTPRNTTLSSRTKGTAAFQLHGDNDDLTPQPRNELFHK